MLFSWLLVKETEVHTSLVDADGGAVAGGVPLGEGEGVFVADGLVHGGDDDEDGVAGAPFADAFGAAEEEGEGEDGGEGG